MSVMSTALVPFGFSLIHCHHNFLFGLEFVKQTKTDKKVTGQYADFSFHFEVCLLAVAYGGIFDCIFS